MGVCGSKPPMLMKAVEAPTCSRVESAQPTTSQVNAAEIANTCEPYPEQNERSQWAQDAYAMPSTRWPEDKYSHHEHEYDGAPKPVSTVVAHSSASVHETDTIHASTSVDHGQGSTTAYSISVNAPNRIFDAVEGHRHISSDSIGHQKDNEARAGWTWFQSLGSAFFSNGTEVSTDSAPDHTAARHLQAYWRGKQARKRVAELRTRGHKRQSSLRKRPNMMDSRVTERRTSTGSPQPLSSVRPSLSFAAPTKPHVSPVRPALSFPASCPTSSPRPNKESEPCATGAAPTSNSNANDEGNGSRVVKRPSFKKALASRLSFKRLKSRLSFRRPASFPLSSHAAKRKAEAEATAKNQQDITPVSVEIGVDVS
mmetsp:Transcript_18120/g.46348  ORF Transcript_18120/g.46348 Transcript_18120/m.46348 type:complete len:369 (+) Transcript_18120:59-1165(+)